MARSKTTTHHSEIRRSRRNAASATATSVPPASTPPPAPVVSPPPSVAQALLPPLAPSSSAPQPTAATSEVLSTATIPTQVMSQGKLDEDMGSDHGTGSQSGSESEDSSRESLQTEHLEEEQQKSGSDFADENVEEEESTNEKDDHLSAEESVPVRLSRAQKYNLVDFGWPKMGERKFSSAKRGKWMGFEVEERALLKSKKITSQDLLLSAIFSPHVLPIFPHILATKLSTYLPLPLFTGPSVRIRTQVDILGQILLIN
ncbi:hypothetical protein Fot_06830 [Forsythia ovata]|uniref:Uncharacterized protein n=1 Tax=Forsythia ovata TaxID=205694 RepID=A0ABD1WU33_9LAMI